MKKVSLSSSHHDRKDHPLFFLHPLYLSLPSLHHNHRRCFHKRRSADNEDPRDTDSRLIQKILRRTQDQKMYTFLPVFTCDCKQKKWRPCCHRAVTIVCFGPLLKTFGAQDCSNRPKVVATYFALVTSTRMARNPVTSCTFHHEHLGILLLWIMSLTLVQVSSAAAFISGKSIGFKHLLNYDQSELNTRSCQFLIAWLLSILPTSFPKLLLLYPDSCCRNVKNSGFPKGPWPFIPLETPSLSNPFHRESHTRFPFLTTKW